MGLTLPLLVLLTLALALTQAGVQLAHNEVYQSEWAVHFKDGHDPTTLDSTEFENLGPIANLKGWYMLRHKPTRTRHVSSKKSQFNPAHEITNILKSHPYINTCEQQKAEPLVPQDASSFLDPLYESQWHLHNTGQFGATPGVDANILGAWQKGYSGKGVRIAIVDDGLQYDHPDLAEAYHPESSWDINGNDSSPYPDIKSDPHGTAVAGVAGARSNSACGVGSAFQSELAAVRLTAGPSTDFQRATALTYKYNDNHIYSNSYGPVGTQNTVGRRGTLTIAAMEDGVKNGRNGKGSIYVYAAGNGGEARSNCNYNGFTNAMETIAVGAVGFDGVKTYYGELCAAMLISAPTGTSLSDSAGVRTTDLVGTTGYDTSDCTSTFSGTSSACPLVSGIVALMLEANPALTWRDVQNILATTAAITDEKDSDWKINGAGYHVNHKYGFGRVDATAAVNKALNYKMLGEQVVSAKQVTVTQPIPDYPATGVTALAVVDDEFPVETVVVVVYIDHPTSGDLQLKLVSPSGTESYLSYPHADMPTILVDGFAEPVVVGGARFGPALSFAATQYYKVVFANPSDLCTAPSNCAAISGNLALVSTSAYCSVFQQAKVMQECGAKGVLVIGLGETVSTIPLPADSNAALITIPTVQVSKSMGANLTTMAAGELKVALQQGKYLANDYDGWSFSSVRNWGESSKGTWSLTVTDGFENDKGTFYSMYLYVHGSLTANSSYTAPDNFITPPPAPPRPSSTALGPLPGSDESYEATSGTSFAGFNFATIACAVFLVLALSH